MALEAHPLARRVAGAPLWAISVLVIGAAAARLVNLGSAPYFFCDEAYTAETTLGLMRTGAMVRYFLDVPVLNVGKPIFHCWIMGGAFKVLGVGVWQGRLPSALLGIGTAILVYLLARRLFGTRAGLMALALYGFSRYAVYIDRSMKEDGQATFFAVLGIYLFLLAWEADRPTLMAAAGLSLGLSVFSKASSFFVPLGLLVYLGILCARMPHRGGCLRAWSLLVVTSALPMGAWAVYVLCARHHPPYSLPLEHFTGGITTEWMYGTVRSVLARGGLKPVMSGAVHLFAGLLLRDAVRLLGFVGLLWLAVARRREGGILWAVVAGGLVCYALAERQQPRQLHVAYVAAIVSAAGLLGAISWQRNQSRSGVLVSAAAAVLCLQGFLFETTVDGIHFKPIIEPDTPEVRAMAWLRSNIPSDERLYCAANVGVFSGHEYVPIAVFSGDARAVDAFDLKYLVLDRYYCHGVLMGYYPDPSEEFELRKVHEVPTKRPGDRVEIYRIVGRRKGAKPVPWYLDRDRSFNFY